MFAETLRMLQKAFDDLTMSQKNAYKWYKDFKEGRERVDDLERPGRPLSSTDEQHVNQIKELVHKHCQLTIRDLADTIGISRGSFNTVSKDILGRQLVTISPKTQHISFHNHHIRLIWLHVTSSYSPNSKDHSEDTVLTRWKRYKPNRRRLWRQFRKSNLTSVSTIGKNDGISPLYREGIILEGMKLIWINK